MYEQVRARLRERIELGATLEEIETIVNMTRGLRPHERRELWWFAWGYAPPVVAAAPEAEPVLH
jgi:hypothetical protein